MVSTFKLKMLVDDHLTRLAKKYWWLVVIVKTIDQINVNKIENVKLLIDGELVKPFTISQYDDFYFVDYWSSVYNRMTTKKVDSDCVVHVKI